MEPSVVARFRWTADELLQAYEYHDRHTCRPPFRVALHCTIILISLMGCSLIYTRTSIVSGTICVAIGVYWFALRRFIRRWMVRRQFRKRPDRDVELEWQFSCPKICVQSRLGQSELIWEIFGKVVRTPSGFMLYPNDQMFHWLPRHGFASDAEYEKCIALVREKIVNDFEVTA